MASLIHRWPLTVNANDSVGSLHLTNNGGVTFSQDGASFNGSSQWLSGVKTLPPQNTIVYWIKPNSYAGIQSPFLFTNSGAPYGVYGLQLNTDGTTVVSAFYGDSTNKYTIAGTYDNSFATSSSYTMLAFTSDTKVYKNTSLIGSGTAMVTPDTHFAIGQAGLLNSQYFNGIISDARIYDYAISASEISALAAAGPNPGRRLCQAIGGF